MLRNLVTTAIEASDYRIARETPLPNGSGIQLEVEPGPLTVVVSDQRFEVQGQPNQQRKLHKLISNGIRPHVREEALKVLEKGCEEWNKWRQTYGQLVVDFSGLKFQHKNFFGCDFRNVVMDGWGVEEANLASSNLSGCYLRRAEMKGADLRNADLAAAHADGIDLCGAELDGAKLWAARLIGANLKSATITSTVLAHANLKGANLSKADLRGTSLSEAIIDEKTIFRGAKGVEIGINGVWSRDTDSAALLSTAPLGNSMKGPSSEAVLESLKRARKYLGFSFLLGLLTALVVYLDLTTVKLPFPRDLDVKIDQYILLAMVFSVGFLVLAKSFMDDAFEGMRYLSDRKSAMLVGSFPWPLTRFAGDKWNHRVVSYLSRTVLALHPLVYTFVIHYSRTRWYEVVLLTVVALLGMWILISSRRFQKPILFDRETERRDEEETVLQKLDDINRSLRDNLAKMR